jgi:hypothetical protein
MITTTDTIYDNQWSSMRKDFTINFSIQVLLTVVFGLYVFFAKFKYPLLNKFSSIVIIFVGTLMFPIY